MSRSVYVIALVFCTLCFPLLSAQTINGTFLDDVKPGFITPNEGFLWKLDIWLDKIQLKIERNPSKRLEKAIKIAQERLLEAENSLNKGDTVKANLALIEHENALLLVEEELDRVQVNDVKQTDVFIKAIERHKAKMAELMEKHEDKKQDMSFEKIIAHADEVAEHLSEVKKVQMERFTPDFSNCTGKDVPVRTTWQNPVTWDVSVAEDNCEARAYKVAGWSLLPE